MVRAILPAAFACIAISGCITAPEPVTVELVNQTSTNIVPNLYASASATDAASLFSDPANRYTAFVDRPIKELLPGETASLVFDCESLASVGSQFPQSFEPVTLTVVNSTEEQFQLNGTHFVCGKIVRFTYFNDSGGLHVRVDVTE